MKEAAPVAGKLIPPTLNKRTLNSHKGPKQTTSQEVRIAVHWQENLQDFFFLSNKWGPLDSMIRKYRILIDTKKNEGQKKMGSKAKDLLYV